MRIARRTSSLLSVSIIGAVAVLTAGAALGQAAGGHSEPQRPAFTQLPSVPLFFSEMWHRDPGDEGEHPVRPTNLSNPDLSLEVFGSDAKQLVIAGMPPGTPRDREPADYVLNLWSGLSSAPIAVLLRDRNRYVDLTGRAKIRWVIRTAGFHVVRPAIRLADGALLVGDYADSSMTIFAEREFAIADVRWLRLDPDRVVTVGTYGPAGQSPAWYPNPDLSRVDAVGWADLMPGSGHNPGGWVNFGSIEVYGGPVPRT